MTMIAMTPAQGLHLPPAGPRVFAAPDPGVRAHLAAYGTIPDVDAQQLLEQVRISGLTGRGEDAAPLAQRFAAAAAAGPSLLVADGVEGGPLDRKDVELVRRAPHLVLDGIEVAARITGARQAFAQLRPEAVAAFERALAEHPRSVPITVFSPAQEGPVGPQGDVVADLYAAGVLPWLSRQLFARGFGGRTTVAQNVESLAQLALVARFGGSWFAGAGTPDSTGTFLATVHPARSAVGAAATVWEINHGLPVGQVLAAATGGPPERFQAVLVGGQHGGWLPLPAAADTPLSRAGLAPFGTELGTGTLIPLETGDCGLEATAALLAPLADRATHRCEPGGPAASELVRDLTALAAGRLGSSGSAALRRTVDRAVDRAGTAPDVCAHHAAAAGLVRSALRVFSADVRLHQHGRCLARIGQPYGGGR